MNDVRNNPSGGYLDGLHGDRIEAFLIWGPRLFLGNLSVKKIVFSHRNEILELAFLPKDAQRNINGIL